MPDWVGDGPVAVLEVAVIKVLGVEVVLVVVLIAVEEIMFEEEAIFIRSAVKIQVVTRGIVLTFHANAYICINPEIVARRSNRRIPAVELCKRNVVIIENVLATSAIHNVFPLVTCFVFESVSNARPKTASGKRKGDFIQLEVTPV
jgi:hypothetical protein